MKTIAAKVILVGNEGVGKTSLVLKLIDRNFNLVVTPTIGASLFKCCLNFNDTLINMQIWDTAGQERFRSMVPLYYRNVNAAFVVFDITRHYTFTGAKFWANELILKVESPIVLTVIGNKKDLSKHRTVPVEEALRFAKEIGAFYYESSTQEFQGIQEIFFNTARELIKYSECSSGEIHTEGKDSILVYQNSNEKSTKNCAFLLCDLQEKFRPILFHFQEIVQSAVKLAKLSEILNIPLIVTEQNPKSLGNTVTDIKKDHAKGTFAKTKFSMCIPEVVNELDKIHDLKCIVLFGIETHACIEQTAIELKTKGLDVHVVADACTSRSLEDRLLALERMKQMGCFISTTESVIFKLLTDASHPKFSEIRPLVKNITPYTGLCGLGSFEKAHL